MKVQISEIIKLVLQALRESDDKENKYHLVMAHNELMKIFENESSSPKI